MNCTRLRIWALRIDRRLHTEFRDDRAREIAMAEL